MDTLLIPEDQVLNPSRKLLVAPITPFHYYISASILPG